MSVETCRAQLTELLEVQIASIAVANDSLLQIKHAIAENRIEQLQQTLLSADLPIDDIEQLEQKRHQLLGQFGFSQDSEGFEQCVDWCDDAEGGVSSLYRQLVKDLVSLQKSLQINHLLVNKGQERVRRSIGILTGTGSAFDSYNQSGKALNANGQRDIAVV